MTRARLGLSTAAAVLLSGASAVLAAGVLRANVDHPAPTTSSPTATPAATPTFAQDIAPIVYSNCVTCHRPGQSAPFSLLTYEDARKHGKTMATVTARRYMPPWHASRAEGFPEFEDERRLTEAQIATIKAWVDAGMPSGDLSKAPELPVFHSGWSLGIPDLIVKMPRVIPVPAEGPDQYRNVTVNIDLPDDRWITALDFEPSVRSVVHHALFFEGPAGVAIGDNEIVPGVGGSLGGGLLGGGGRGAAGRGAAAGPGRQGRGGGALASTADEAWGGLGGWVPGVTPRFYPEGIAQSLPKHSNIVIQLHLHPTGKAEQEDGDLGIYFAKTPPAKSLAGIQVPPVFGFAMGIDIPAGEPHYAIHDSFVLPVNVEAFGARGHAHYLCREMKMTATLPNGETKGLLWIKDWDFSWQDSYYYKKSFNLPKGTRIDTDIIYDNSDANPRNPNSPVKEVKWGRESFDEMGSMTLLVAAPQGADGDALKAAETQHLRQQVIDRYIRR